MPNILDQYMKPTTAKFIPQSVPDYFALQLALRLKDGPAAAHYRQLLDQHSEGRLLAAYRQVLRDEPDNGKAGRSFHAALGHIRGPGDLVRHYRLLAIHIQRRTMAVAYFIGTQLDYTQSHHLPAKASKAEQSASGFVARMIANLKVDSAALEQVAVSAGPHLIGMSAMIHAALSRQGVPVWTIGREELLFSFGHPAPRSHESIRKIMTAVWPVLGPDAAILDAVALGLYVQTARQFPSAE